MKILHISSGNKSSGVSKGAYNLHKALIEENIESTFISPDDLKKNIFKFILFRLLFFFEKILKNFYFSRCKTSFTSAFFGISIKFLKEYKEADIIHVHWLGNTFLNLNFFSHSDKELVFSLRDMWFLTGGCHYSLGCKKFYGQCKKCPQLKSSFKYDLSYFSHRRKKLKFNKSLNLITVSKWINKQLKLSSIGKNNYNNITIENIAEKKIFFKESNANLKIKYKDKIKDKKIIIYGASNISAKYKGFDHFLKILTKIDINKYFLFIFGNFWEQAKLNDVGIDYMNFGFVNSNDNLRKIYNSGDLFISTSIQDAFPKTFVESMLCGTPVICFDETSMSDYLTHKKNSYIAKNMDYDDFANGINWLSFNKNKDIINNEARDLALSKFDAKVLARKHIDFYKKILEKKHEN